MKIVVTGSNGQLGREIAMQGHAHELILTDYDNLDITNAKETQSFFREVKPDAVIHCAAYTNVDKAENDFDGAYKVNVIGAQNVAAGCLECGARMVYVSTDYVFDGLENKVYREYDTVNPQSVYGKTKQLGEQMVRDILGRHYITRTAWLYGEGNNFVRTMLNLAKTNPELRVVNDQIGTPTSTTELARSIFRLLNTDAYGTYHTTCKGQCSWHDFACEIFRQANLDVKVMPVSTSEFPRPAKRPPFAVLDNYLLEMTIGDEMCQWKEALKVYLEKEKRNKGI